MKKLSLVFLALVVSWSMLYMGCMDREPAPVCPVPLEVVQDEVLIGGFDGVDLLLVVDNSISMEEEQAILASSVFPLVNSLVNPLPTWKYEAADNVRIGVVTSDLGLSYGGNPYENGDGWPGDAPCTAVGDDGRLQTTYIGGNKINVIQDFIACGEDATQCPPQWTCDNIDSNGVGVCHDPSGDGTGLTCPGSPSDLGMNWFETVPGTPKTDLAFSTACLSNMGTNGCGFEQQLQAAARALSRDDQLDFVRDNKLLVVLVVSDEEDCSMDDGPSLFASDEVQNNTKWNIACGVESNQKFLYESDHFFDTFKAAKGGENGSVVFAAIVGVPPKEDTCQGQGKDIGGCLDHPDMQLTERIEDKNYFWEYACERGDSTKAYPGRRYVDLAANYYPAMSYIYSICNEDWSPAMEAIAELIASNMNGTCYDSPLDYDVMEGRAKCDVIVEYIDATECPSIEIDGEVRPFDEEPKTKKVQGDNDQITTNIYCTLPQLNAKQNCSEIKNMDDLTGQFGWYYCENNDVESFDGACKDKIDNDGDGKVDCDDDECVTCEACGGDGSECKKLCAYQVTVTSVAENEIKGHAIEVQCITQYAFEDPNCQEDVFETCNNGVDDDGNGVYDCDAVSVEDALEDDTIAHNADPNCCPLDPDTCTPLPSVKETCKNSEYPPAACHKAAEALECKLNK